MGDRKHIGGRQRSLSFLTFFSCCEGPLLVGKCLLLYFKNSLQRKWNDLCNQVTMLELQYSYTEDEHPSHIFPWLDCTWISRAFSKGCVMYLSPRYSHVSGKQNMKNNRSCFSSMLILSFVYRYVSEIWGRVSNLPWGWGAGWEEKYINLPPITILPLSVHLKEMSLL